MEVVACMIFPRLAWQRCQRGILYNMMMADVLYSTGRGFSRFAILLVPPAKHDIRTSLRIQYYILTWWYADAPYTRCTSSGPFKNAREGHETDRRFERLQSPNTFQAAFFIEPKHRAASALRTITVSSLRIYCCCNPPIERQRMTC